LTNDFFYLLDRGHRTPPHLEHRFNSATGDELVFVVG